MAITRPDLGHGIGLRSVHFPDWLASTPPVGFAEAISENFLAPGGRPIAVLEKVRRDVPVALHGVSLAIGSVEPPPDRTLGDLARLVGRIEPALVTEHLCWGRHRGTWLHDLLPLPYTEESLAHLVERVSRVQDRLGRQILLENPSAYLTYRESPIPEWQFLAALCEGADCGILLDVNNVFVSSQNLGFDPVAYLDGIPPARVGQIHLAGHADRGTHLLDTHDRRVADPVWDLYRHAIRRLGPVPTLVEWDESIPPIGEVLAESARALALESQVIHGPAGAQAEVREGHQAAPSARRRVS
jgi:uncharacterized protein (UPF0276 family)